MKGCRILNTRKRVIVALVHTVVFFCVAAVQIWLPPSQSGILTAIYALVTAALAILTAKSGRRQERYYFACCTGSACLGLTGQLWGGALLQNAAFPRATLLAAAAVTGISMLRAKQVG
jgi:hypothetical protein